MHPFLLLMLALLTPFALALVLLGPVYAGVLGAVYFIYLPASDAPHPLAAQLNDVFYIIDVYQNLFAYWLQHLTDVALFGYTLPLLGLPLFGFGMAFYATRKLVRKLMDIFHLSVTN